MKKLAMVLGLTACVSLTSVVHAQDAVRFPPLKAEELTAEQKALADRLGMPPRNGKVNNPPFRAYARSSRSFSSRWRITCAGIRRCRRA